VSHLVFPDEVQNIQSEAKGGAPDGRIGPIEIAAPESSVDDAVALLRNSKRPVVVVGHGARFEMKSVVALAEHLNAPVLTTFKGKGLIADDHPLGCGVLGRSGTPIASWFMNESDSLLVFGASFSNHAGITPKRPTIQVDLDRMTLGKFHAVDVPVWGEIGRTAERFLSELKDGESGWVDRRPEVAERWEIWREEKASREAEGRRRGVSSAAIFASLNRRVPDDAIIAVDVGNNTYSFGRYFECKRQSVLMSGYLGSIGFSLPAAMGAWAATQEKGTPFHGRPVVSISGDGGFGQYMSELTTAVKYGMNITHFLLHNGELGKISKEQRAGEWEVWQTSLHNPNFSKFAKLCGAFGTRVKEADELDSAVKKALEHDGPALVEILADPLLV